MKIAVLGCGPAGLMVAHAVTLAGYEPYIISKRVKSRMYGAMYLHQRLPGMKQEPDFQLEIVKTGSAEGYAQKVYGDWRHPVSFSEFEGGKFPAWDLRKAYDWLWTLYNLNIQDFEVDRGFLDLVASENDIVFSTIPAALLCDGSHDFHAQQIYVLHGEDPYFTQDRHLMWYEGRADKDWYRFSQFGNYLSWEYSDRVNFQLRMPYQVTYGTKPISNNCDCLPENVIRLGRFGAWKKGCLTHHAYEEAREVLSAL